MTSSWKVRQQQGRLRKADFCAGGATESLVSSVKLESGVDNGDGHSLAIPRLYDSRSIEILKITVMAETGRAPLEILARSESMGPAI